MLLHLRILAFLALLTFLGAARPARASHAVGGSITYTSLGGNSYRVRVDFFRDCSTIAAPTSFTLNCQNTCGGAALQTATLPQVGSPFIGTPYGSMVQALGVCPINGASPGGFSNFATYRYEGTVTLLPNQWILAVEEGSRPTVANTSAATMRLEATLDNRTLPNTSVVFSNTPIVFIPNGLPNLLHIGAFDADGDSLAYEMVKPLNGCGTYETYTQYPQWACQPYVISSNPLCILNCSFFGSGSYYSAKVPLPVTLDTVGSCPNKYLAPHFSFDSLSSAIGFTTTRYLSTPNANGDNKYLASVKVTEWRKVNGRYVTVGTTRRDLMWVIHDTYGTTMPRLAPTVTVQDGLQTRTQALTVPIPVLAGEPISVSFSAATASVNLPLAFTLEQNTIPGAVVQAGTTPGTARLTFTPPLSLPNGTYRVSLTVTDDASPWRDLITVPVTFHVYRTVLATRNASMQAIAAYPTPFTERVQFQLPSAGVQALTVCDNLGRVVAHLTSQADGKVLWTPGHELPAGLYLAHAANGKQVVRLLRSAAQ